MNPMASFSKTLGTNAAFDSRGALRTQPRNRRGAMRVLLTTAALGVLCASMAGCGDGSSSNASNGGSSNAANNAAAGAGGASAPVPIVAAPASGACAASGASAAQPLQNTQLVCAP